MQRWLDAGEDVDCSGAKGFTPLMRAASAGHTDVVALLIAEGADLFRRDVKVSTV